MKPIIAVPAIAALVYRAWSHKSLTPAGIVVAALTAVAHAVHPWNMPFVLLVVFFLAGTRVTKIKQSEKEKLTLGSKGSPGGEGPRTHIQVLANSLVASILILLHAWQLHHQVPSSGLAKCYPYRGSILPIGIIAHYAAVCADTFSSELGILSRSPPRLITSLTLRKVPPGTNGGVTAWGLAAGLLGALVVVSAAMLSLPLCKPDPSTPPPATPGELDASPYWTVARLGIFVWSLALCGLAGSLLDSILGGLFQRTVRDVQTGKIVEGEGGARVLVTDERRDARVRASLNAAVLRGAEGTSAVEEMDAVGKNQARLTRSGKMAAEEMEEKRKTSFGAGPSRVVESGINLLDNNQVNILMAALVSLGAMAAASVYWGVPLSSAFALS